MGLKSFFELILIISFFCVDVVVAQIKVIPSLPDRDFGNPSNLTEARLQDLRMFEDIVDINASFSDENRAKAKASIAILRNRIDTITELEFLIELHKIYALHNNAHDEGRFALFPRGWGSLPFRGYWFDGQYRIIRVLPGYEELLGARITHYGDIAIDEVNVKLKVLNGGSLDFFRSVVGDAVMTTPAVLYHMGITPSFDEVEVHLVMRDGNTKVQVMRPSAPGRSGNPSTASGRLLFPNFHLDNWISLIPQPETPIYLRGDDPLNGEAFVYTELGAKKIPYVQLRLNYSTEKQSLPDFVKRVEDAWNGRQFPFIIIDLRLDQGGNTLLTQHFFQSLDQYLLPQGKIYVAIGKRTFSAGINSVALIKHGNTAKTIFIGEDIGDKEQYWSETQRVSLPNSEIKFTYSAALHDLENGCRRPECYWWYFENANPKIGEIRPNIYVPFTFEDYLNGRDEILDKIELIENVDFMLY